MNDIEAFELFNKEYDWNFVVTVDRIYVNYTSKATGTLNWTGADTLQRAFTKTFNYLYRNILRYD